jgi:hypothetical protein
MIDPGINFQQEEKDSVLHEAHTYPLSNGTGVSLRRDKTAGALS